MFQAYKSHDNLIARGCDETLILKIFWDCNNSLYKFKEKDKTLWEMRTGLMKDNNQPQDFINDLIIERGAMK